MVPPPMQYTGYITHWVFLCLQILHLKTNIDDTSVRLKGEFFSLGSVLVFGFIFLIGSLHRLYLLDLYQQTSIYRVSIVNHPKTGV